MRALKLTLRGIGIMGLLIAFVFLIQHWPYGRWIFIGSFLTLITSMLMKGSKTAQK